MGTNPTNGKKYNFDPNSYEPPPMSTKDGEYTPSDYQAAQALRKFIKDNSPDGFINASHIRTAYENGRVDFNGRVITLNKQEQAAFDKLAENEAALWNRLDGGTNGTHDGVIGVLDINDAITKTRRLHGSATSDKGYWSDPTGSMTAAEAKTTLDGLLKERFGENWTSISQSTLQQIADKETYFDHSSTQAHHLKYRYVDGHQYAVAAAVLLKHWGKIQEGGNNSVGVLSRDEFENLSKV